MINHGNIVFIKFCFHVIFRSWWKTGFDTIQGFQRVQYTELLLEFSQQEVLSKG